MRVIQGQVVDASDIEGPWFMRGWVRWGLPPR